MKIKPINKIICKFKCHYIDSIKDEYCHKCGTEIKCHWYSYTFQGTTPLKEQVTACTYVGYPFKFVTEKMIVKAKEYAGVEKGSVLLSCCYLGYMTKNYFKGQS